MRTSAYCFYCLFGLNPSTAKTPADQILLQALGFSKDKVPNYVNNHQTVLGRCAKCGTDTLLVYYEPIEREALQ